MIPWWNKMLVITLSVEWATSQIMNVEMYSIKKEDEEGESLGSQDSYSQRSLTTQPDEYQEDSFLMIETENLEYGENEFLDIKRDYLRRKKNLNKECCRRTLEYNEDYFLMKIHEKELEMAKLEKKKKLKYEENVRNKKNDDIFMRDKKM